jgi:S1-C subfamily serine protease
LRPGDLVLQLDGQKVQSVRDLLRLAASSAGKTAQVAVYREQRRVSVELRAKK